MKTTAIIQARMGSSRLPGKVLLPLAGRPVIDHVVERAAAARRIEQVVVATTDRTSDDPLAAHCEGRGVPCFRGSETDVLDRYVQCMRQFDAGPVVRITADCPMLDPQLVDAVIEGFAHGGYDLYGLAGEFPDGLDCVVFSRAALETAWREARLPSERQHVGPYIEHHPERFRVGGHEPFQGLGHLRWTLDEPRDYEFLQRVFDALDRPGEPFGAHDVLKFLEQHPEITAINAGIVRNEGYLKSLEEDRRWIEQGERSHGS